MNRTTDQTTKFRKLEIEFEKEVEEHLSRLNAFGFILANSDTPLTGLPQVNTSEIGRIILDLLTCIECALNESFSDIAGRVER